MYELCMHCHMCREHTHTLHTYMNCMCMLTNYCSSFASAYTIVKCIYMCVLWYSGMSIYRCFLVLHIAHVSSVLRWVMCVCMHPATPMLQLPIFSFSSLRRVSGFRTQTHPRILLHPVIGKQVFLSNPKILVLLFVYAYRCMIWNASCLICFEIMII